MALSPNPVFLRESARRFLGRLPLPKEQLLEIRTVIPDRRGARSGFCSSVTEAIGTVELWSGRANVYLGACPRGARSGQGSAITWVTTAWADLDFHQIDVSDRGRAEQLALRRLDSFNFAPTILVHTGNGFQAWWLYDEPVAISKFWPAERFEAINRGLAQALGGDAVHDLARVLRVPGTINLPDAKKRARGCVPVMARLIQIDGPTHAPTEFDSLAIKTPIQPRPAAVRPEPTPQPDGEILDAFDRLLEQFGPDHPLTRTWRGQRLLRDCSRSGWDMALVNHLVRARIRNEFIPVIVRAFPYGRGVLATDAYISRTLAKASIGVKSGTG